MTYEFTYFHEPDDETKPVVKLIVEMQIDFTGAPHPANPARTAYSCEPGDIDIYDRMGRRVTMEYATLIPRILHTFYKLHMADALDRYVAYEGTP